MAFGFSSRVLGFRVYAFSNWLGFRVLGLGFSSRVLRFRVYGFRFKVFLVSLPAIFCAAEGLRCTGQRI